MKWILLLILVGMILVSLPCSAESLNTGGPYSTGDTLIIQGDTNYNTDNKVLIEVYPASFGPTKKYEPTMAGGSSTVVPVQKKNLNEYAWSANISTTGWKPDQYFVRIEVIGKDYRESSVFTLNEKNETVLSPEKTPNSIGNTSVENFVPSLSVTPAPLTTQSDEVSQKIEEPLHTPAPESTQKSPGPFGITLIAVFLGLVVLKVKR